MKKFAILVVLFALSTVASAQDSHERMYSYETRPGDTLIGIGQALLEHPLQWPRLQTLNKVRDPYRLQPNSTLLIPLSLMKQDPATGRVTAINGHATRNGNALAPGDSIHENDRLATGEQSFVTIELIDGSRLLLQPESQLRARALRQYRNTRDTQTVLELDQGRIESMVTRNATPKPKYIIRTPTAAIGVRGTEFRVAAEAPGNVRTEVTGGEVGVESGRARTAVTTGFGQITEPDGALRPPVPLLPPPDLQATATLYERPVVRFVVPAIPGAHHYRFQVGRDSGMTAVLAERIADKEEAKFPELADGEYTLRVRGIDENGLEGQDADLRFKLKARPEPPFARSPANAARLRAAAIGLEWTTNPDAARYRIQIARSPEFSDVLSDFQPAAGQTNIPAMTLPPGEYFWRARSIRPDEDTGPWSDAFTFTLRPLPPAPEPPVIEEHTVNFGWTGEPGQRFLFQLASDADFRNLLAERQLDEPKVALARPEAGRYYLRVQATDPDGVVGPFTTTQIVDIPNLPPPRWLPLLLMLAPLL